MAVQEAGVAEPRPQPPEASRLPTLTEVVLEGLPVAAPLRLPPAPALLDEARIVDAVMAGLQPRIDLMFEYRLREALAPLLARAAEPSCTTRCDELAGTLRDVVARAVSQELARRRHPLTPPPGACCRPVLRAGRCRVRGVATRRVVARRGGRPSNPPLGRPFPLRYRPPLFNLSRLSARQHTHHGGSFMQVKFNAIVGAAVILMAGSAYAQDMVVKIGHVGPTSGQIAHLGKDNENGARMAIDELNAKGVTIGGKKVKFELLAEDDAADPKQGTAAAQKLVDAKVNGVIGHLNSGTTIPASKIYSDAGIPQISPSATNPKYTRNGYKTAFRVVADDVHLGGTLGKYAVKELKGKSIAVIDDRTAYGQGVADEFEKGVKAAGGKTVGREFTNDKATDFTAILTSLKAKKPDIVFFGGMDAVAGPMMRQMKQLGIRPSSWAATASARANCPSWPPVPWPTARWSAPKPVASRAPPRSRWTTSTPATRPSSTPTCRSTRRTSTTPSTRWSRRWSRPIRPSPPSTCPCWPRSRHKGVTGKIAFDRRATSRTAR
jgi:ABC-type branched-subunit amino acid transport system substrate-binding protein